MREPLGGDDARNCLARKLASALGSIRALSDTQPTSRLVSTPWPLWGSREGQNAPVDSLAPLRGVSVSRLR